MVDIHSHIVYGVDDGSTSLERSIEMLTLAAESGTTDIVATPHANHDFQFRPDVNSARLEEMRKLAPAGIRIHSGCDFHLSYENVESAFRDPKPYTINGLNYLLVEFPDGEMIPNIGEIFDRMVGMGLNPVITHPERNWMIQQNFETMRDWVNRGALVQVTAGSLTGRFGKPAAKFAVETIDAGICHFIASDAHDTRDRHPKLQKAYDLVRDKWGEETAQRLFVENGKAAIQGDFIAQTPPKPKKRWFFF